MTPDEPNTTARLRHDIDHGRTGDKVSFMDPAAAPLGTDDEAAGTPPTAEQVARARESEIRHPPGTGNASATPQTVGEMQGRKRGRGIGPLPALLVVVALIIAAVFLL